MRPLVVLGTGHALPGIAVSTDELLERLDARFTLSLSRRGHIIAHRLGIGSRHVCRDFLHRFEAPRRGDSNAELAARAVRAALTDAGCDLANVRYLIAHTATPGRSLPAGAADVADRLGYDGPFAEFRQACTGFANALIFAQGALSSVSPAGHPAAGVVVIVGSETGSVYFDPHRADEDNGQLINLMQMGDAAAAVVLAAPDSGTYPHPQSPQYGRILGSFHGQLGHGRGSAFQLHAGGAASASRQHVPLEFQHDYERVRAGGAELLRAGLEAGATLGVTTDELSHIIPHQANGHMATLMAKELSCATEKIFVNAHRVANTGSAAIWLALSELRPALASGSRVLVVGAEATRFMYGGFVYAHGAAAR